MKTLLLTRWSAIIVLLVANFHPAQAALVQAVSAADPALDYSTGGDGDSVSPVMSPDARYVLFASTAHNLIPVASGTAGSLSFPARFNVFLRERTNGLTSLVSINLAGTGGGNGDSLPLAISADGRYALFETSASDLVEDDTNQVNDIVMRDLVQGVNILVSRGATGGMANGVSRGAVMTPNGRFVAFVSAADNLVANDTNGIPDVFVLDLELGKLFLASPDAVASKPYASRSESPVISADGRHVAYYSTATNLVSGVATTDEIYVRDLITETTLLASAEARTMLFAVTGNTNAVCFNHALSADGKYVAYAVSVPTNRWSGLILRYALETGATDLVHTNARLRLGPREDARTLDITPDGRFIAFIANTPTNGGSETVPGVCVWDAQTGVSTLASVDVSGEPARGAFDWPTVNPTGRFVSFTSTATNMTTNAVSPGYHLYVRDLHSGQTDLADRMSTGDDFGINAHAPPRLSADGQWVAFQAFDPQSNRANTRPAQNVFLRDRLNDTTELISERQPESGGISADGMSGSWGVSVNGNGRYVAFASLASNLVANDANTNRDVFVRDLLTQTTILASVATNGFSADGMSFEPAVSRDGRFVAFTSTATDLSPVDTNRFQDVFVFDQQTGSVAPGSVATNGASLGNNSSSTPFVSEGGRHLFFRSKASNLAPGSFTAGKENLFWRDFQTGVTVALTTGGLDSWAVTPDGRHAAFGTGASVVYIWDSLAAARIQTNNVGTGVAVLGISPDGQRFAYSVGPFTSINVRDRISNANWVVGSLLSTVRPVAKFSGDGQFLTYASPVAQGLTDTNGTSDIYLFHLPSQTKTVVSRAFVAGRTGNGTAELPDVSYDGRFVVYRSAASDLVPVDTNYRPDVFLYDRLTGENRLLSAGPSGDSANNRSHAAVFSSDGRTVVFPSWASDLIARDFNQTGDLFAFTFLYATITQPAGHPPVISWPATPGQNYQVQFKDAVDDPNWRDVAGSIVVTNGQAVLQDASAGDAHRIYRVSGF